MAGYSSRSSPDVSSIHPRSRPTADELHSVPKVLVRNRTKDELEPSDERTHRKLLLRDDDDPGVGTTFVHPAGVEPEEIGPVGGYEDEPLLGGEFQMGSV